MRLAFVTQPGHAVLPPAGSIELWTHAVASALSVRHEVSIYASQSPREPAAAPGGIAFRFIPHGRGRTLVRGLRAAYRLAPVDRPFFASAFHPLEYWARVAHDVRRRGVDVVHIVNYSQALPIFRRLTRAKLVLHMHCEWLSQLDARMIDRRLRHADLIVGCSEYITNKVRERFPHHAARCTTVYNGVEAERPAPWAKSDRTVIELLNVGRVSPEKGLHVLVDALERVVAKHPEVRLTIVGEESPVPHEFAVAISADDLVRRLGRFYGGSYLDHLRERMSDPVAERVTFVDRVRHEETRHYYEDADIFVFPSIFEAFPIPPIEAMAAGLPVVASEAGGVVESVVHERTGLIVEREDPQGLADAIIRLVEDGPLRRSFGQAGQARAADLYAWPRVVADFEARVSALAGAARVPAVVPENAVGLE